VSDPNHFSYSLSAKALRRRRDNLVRSIADLREQLADARNGLKDAESELAKIELLADKGVGTVLPGAQKSELQISSLRP
jgi:hypothetical protein